MIPLTRSRPCSRCSRPPHPRETAPGVDPSHSVSRALREVALGLLDDHVLGCVTNAARTDPTQAEEKFADLTEILRRALRL